MKYARAVRRTLHWLVEERFVDEPMSASGEAQYLLCHAERLHESLRRLSAPKEENERCLVIGSWGLEVPYLRGRLGWRDVTCICAPASVRHESRLHPNTGETYEFELLEHDIESGPLPFEDRSFSLIVFWGCFELLHRRLARGDTGETPAPQKGQP